MKIEEALLRAQESAAPEVGRGRLAEYIPGLAAVDPHQFGMAIASCDGQVHVIGDADVRFSVKSISKVFTLALVVAAEGERIWDRVSREPSGNPFNSLLQLDQEAGRPARPDAPGERPHRRRQRPGGRPFGARGRPPHPHSR